jgi:UDP-N-acetylmuramoylalanine--D-glutamate ligase
MQPVGRQGRVVFVNDSKATNAEAAAPALQSFEPIYWIAGGLPRRAALPRWSHIFPHCEGLSDRRGGCGICGKRSASGRPSRYPARSILRSNAARDAGQDEAEMPAVLLSPACASFDQYRNFEVRGDAFVSLVAALDGIEMLVDARAQRR